MINNLGNDYIEHVYNSNKDVDIKMPIKKISLKIAYISYLCDSQSYKF